MSASLVGSEMCIRDRAMPPQRRCRRPRSPPKAKTTSSSVAVLTIRRLEPVSYTHLTLPTICSV
eukprot:4969160-Alexandrium_andersonii.AAC.1